MPTINDLRQQAATIKNATQVGENTANRVGTTFETIADLLEGMGGVTNLSTIDIGSIDTLNTTGDMLVGTPNIYTLTKTIGANTFKVGTLFQFANNGRYDVAQVIVSQYIIDSDGRIDTTSADQEVHIFYRLCKTMNGGSLPTPIGTWTTWTELGSSGGSGVTIDPYPTQDSGNAVSSGGVFERLQDIAPKVDISAIDDIDEYSDMLATKSPFYVVTKTLSGNVFRIGTLMEFANQGRYILYQILATDYVLNDDGTLDTTLSENGGLKLIWRMKQFSGNPPAGVTIGVWSAWSYLSGDSGYQPDNEDIDLNANDQLQFANKAYDASAFSGLGRVYLRKNIVQLNLTDKYFDGFVNDVLVQDVGTSSTPDAILFDTTRKMFVARVGLLYYVDWSSDEDYNPITRDVNWNYNGNFYRWNGEELVQWDKTINQITQAMINTANTIYHIQYDYTLGEDITIPANCVLEFEGGSISGAYTFTGQNTKINAGLVKIFGSETITNGTWKLSEVYPEWFGAVGDGTTDDTLAIKKIILFGAISGAPVFFSKKTYAVYNTITISSDGVTLKAQRNEWVVNISKKFDGALFNVQTQTPIRHFTLYGIVITGNDFSGSILDFYTDVTNSNRVASLYIDNCEFRHCNDSIIKLSKCWYGYIKQTLFTTCTTALDLYDNINCFNFIGCSFYTCTTAVKMNSECYSNCFINCTFQTTDRSFDIIHSVYGLDILNCYFEGNGTANDAIIEIASVHGLHIGSCIFTKGSRNVPTHIFNISNGRNVTIQGNYISTSFNNIVQLNGTLFQFDVQYSTLIRSNLTRVSLTEGFTSHLNVYHRPDWRVGETIGARMLYTRNSDGTSPVADIIWTGSKWVKTGPFVEYSVPYFGTTANRPTNDSNIYEGFCFYDTSLEKPIFRKSGNWNDANGYIALPSRGTTAERPTDGIVKSSQTGYCYFDTDLKRSIYANYSNTSNSKWRGTYGKSVYKLASVYSIVSGAMYNLMPSVDGTTTIGFCETNDGSTEPVIVLSSSYSTSYFQFKVPDLTQYPYLYISNDKTERLGQELALNVNRITSKWVEEDGATAGVLRSGTFAEKPAAADIYVGFRYFCTDKQTTEGATDGIEITYKGNDVWVDALGRVVS